MTYNNLIFGEHDFAVRARDAMGNVDLTPAEYGWSVEAAVPTVFISSGPDVTTESRTATFEFSAPGRDVRYECAIDGGAFSLCLSPKTYNGVPLGPHTFEVQVWIDEELEVAEPEPATWEWTVVDGIAPETSIVWGPPNPSYATDPESGETVASFALESNDAMATFECALDGAPFTACPEPVQFSGMGPGPHILRARAVDIGLMKDPSPASWVWTVILDSTAPTTTINTAEVFALEGAFEAIFAFSANEPVFEFECQLDADPFEQCETPMQYSDLAPGNHVFRVRAIDLARNIEHPPVTHAFAVGIDVDPPETTLLERPPATTTDDWATFTFESNEPDATFECAIEVEPDVGPAWEECFSPTQFVELEPGAQTFHVRAVDAALNADPTPEVYTWVYNPAANPPETSILDGPPALSTSITAVFQFSATGSGIEEFECALDAEPFESCESPYIVEDLLPGEHLFLVRAVDIFLNADPTPASYSWRVIAPPLEPTIESTPPEPSTGNEHTFTFSSTEQNATFRCRVTPNPFQQTQFTNCSTPHTIRNLPDGEYIFEVIAVNEYGIAGEIPAEWGFEVANAPDTSIVGGPQAVTSSRNAAIAFITSEPSAEATFECSLDGDAFTECLNPFIVPDPNEYVPPDCLPGTESNAAGDACVMSLGTHIFLVQAVDIDGNVDLTPASFTWTVIEGTPPETTIGDGPGSSTTSTSATFTFSSSEGGSTFRCALDAASLATCVSPTTFTGLALGSHQFTVVATDADGTADETPAIYTWTVGEPDTTDPETTIDLGPAALTNHTDAAFRFSAEPGATYACRLNAGTWVHCSSPIGYLDLLPGDHVFEVRATDAAGNVDDTPASYAWTIDGSRPETSITERPADPSNGGFVSFGLAGTDDISAGADLGFQCRLDDAAWVDCATPKSYVNVDNGSHTLLVRATDEAGNTDLTPASYTWLVDNAAPETTITGGPASTVASTDASIAFTSEAGADFECKLDDAAWSDCTSPASYTDLAAGDHTFSVRASDAASNVDPSPATRAWTVDLPPDTTIDTGPSGDTASANATFRFSSNEPGASFECAIDDASYGSCASPLELTGLEVGDHELRVRAKDSFGSIDASPASRTWTVLPPPETTIDSVVPDMGVDAQTESTSVTFTFSADQSGVTFECVLDGLAAVPCTSPVGYTDLAPGSHDFEVVAIGAAGHLDLTPATFGWEIGDLTPPVVTVTLQPDASSDDTTPTFEFSVDDPAAVIQCSLDGAPLLLCTSPLTYTEAQLVAETGTVAGEHSFEVTAVKANLLVDVVPVIVEWTITDATAPETTIASGPGAEVLLDALAPFVFSSNEIDAEFECALDGEPQFSQCAAPPDNSADFGGLDAGQHTLLVRAIDPTGNVDASPESYTWTVIGAPTTSFSSGPTQPETESTSASIAFAADQSGVTYACEFDGEPVADCASPFVRSGLAVGNHTFEVTATNAHAMVEEPPAAYEWTIIEPVDATAPETTIGAGPSGTTVLTEATIEFSANELDATFECSLDAETFASCESPVVLTGLGVGSHTFRVQATDLAGNLDPSPAQIAWTVEAVPPQNTTTGTDVEVAIGDVTITFAEVDAEGTTTVEALASPPALPDGYLDTGATYYGITTTAGYSGPVTICLPAGAAADPARLLHHDGTTWVDITLTAEAGQVCGQADTLSPFAVATGSELVVPETTIDSAPASVSPSATATFHFSAAAPLATFECSIDAGTSWSSCESPHQLTDLVVGSYSIQIRATTVAGIVEATPAVHAWTVVAPNTTIESGPAASTRSTVADFRFSSNDLEATYECSLDGETFGSCDSHFIIEELTIGSHELRVRAVSGAGTVDASAAVHTWTVEGPETTIETGPTEPTWALAATFTFSSDEQTATFECKLDSGTYGSCESPYEINGLSAGTHELFVRALNVAGGADPTPDSHRWTISAMPETTLQTFPDNPTDDPNATFTFTGTPAGATFECALDEAVDDEVFAPCSSPHSYVGLIYGSHDFAVRARDAAGNVDPTPEVYTWEVQILAPEVEIDAAPAERTDSRSATFAFSANAREVAFECALNAGTFSPCTSPKTYGGLPFGAHTFEVRVLVPEDAPEAPITTVTWSVVEFDPPETDIVFGPPSPTDSATAIFAFDSDEAAVTFECALDGAAFTACPIPSELSGLSDGQHSLQVRAVDAFGNADPSADTWVWTVAADRAAPTTTILNGPDQPTTTVVDASFGFTANEPNVTFECALDAEPMAPCESPMEYADLALGEHEFRVAASDLEGNTESPAASYTWTIIADTVAPETTLHARPAANTLDTTATFSFSSNELGAEFECNLDGEGFSGCSNPEVYEELLPGQHTFEVRAVDLAEPTPNVDATPESYTWMIGDVDDTTAPDTSILSGPSAVTSSLIASITFGAEAGATYECSLDGAAYEECESPFEVEVEPGDHVLLVRATDIIGNVEQEPAERRWTVIGPPETTIDDGPDATSNSTSATFTFSADQTDAIFFCDLDGLGVALCTSPKTYTGLIDGEHTLEVVARNPLGEADETPAEFTWTVAVPPNTTITLAPDDPSSATIAVFTFAANEVDATFECSLDGAAYEECESPTDPAYTGLSQGQHTLEVRAIDAEGNVDPTPASHTWFIDTGAPSTTIDTGPASETASTDATFTFSGTDARTAAGDLGFRCSLDGATPVACSSPKTYSGLAAGAHSLSVRAVDEAGNQDPTAATHAWTIAAPNTPAGSVVIVEATTPEGLEANLTFETVDVGGTTTITSTTTVPAVPGGYLQAGATYYDIDTTAQFSGAVEVCLGYDPADVDPALVTLLHYTDGEWVDVTTSNDTTAGVVCGSVESLSPFAIAATSDTSAPSTAIDATPPATTTATTATFTFTADEAATFECALDSGSWAVCTSPKQLTGLSVAAHTFRVRATDAAGNTDATPATHQWTVNAPPNCGSQQTLTANGDAWIQQGSPSSNKGSDSTLKVMSKGPSNNLRALVRFQMPALPQGCVVETATLQLNASAAAGGRTLQALRATATWTENGVTWANQPATTGVAAVTTSGTGNRSWSVTGLVQDMYDASALHGFVIRDATENGDAEQQFNSREKSSGKPVLVLKFKAGIPDTVAPTTSFSAAPSIVGTSATFTFNGTDDRTPGTSLAFQCRLDGAPYGPCTSPRALSGLSLGSHTFDVRAVDAAGNIDLTPATHTWTATARAPDTTDPQTTIDAGPTATTESTSAGFAFSSNEPGSTFTCSLDNGPYAACSSPKTYNGLAVGAHTFAVIATDAAGNADDSAATQAWTISVTCPAPATVNANADAWIDQAGPGTNYGSDSILKVQSKSGNAFRAFVGFQLPAAPEGCTVASATLRLYSPSAIGGRTLEAYRVTEAWTEAGVNWDSQPSTAGTAATAASGTGYREWTVTDLVRAMYANSNHGFLIRDASEAAAGIEQQFHAREKNESVPQLVITFAPQTGSAAGGPIAAAGPGFSLSLARLEPFMPAVLLLLVVAAPLAVASSSATRRPSYVRV